MSASPESSPLERAQPGWRSTFSIPPHWRWPVLLIGLLVVAALVLYRETALGMVEIWARSETFTHAFLVPPIVLWLIWRRRHRLAAVVPQAWLLMLLPLALAAGLWLLGELAHANALRQFALVSVVLACVLLVIGRTAGRVIAFPLAYLYFCVPVGEFLLPVLMEWTADFTVWALRLSGVPVYREGMNFTIPSGNWSVVEACSGVRYLIASLVVGTLFAYLNYRSNRRRLLFIGVSILVPIVANWMRAYMIVMLGHLSNNEIATGVDHLVYGWVFFGIVIMIMFLIGSRWAEPDEDPTVTPVADPSDGATDTRRAVGSSRGRARWGSALAAVVVLILPSLLASATAYAPSAQLPDLSLPRQLAAGWQAVDESAPGGWVPRFENPSMTGHASYALEGQRVGIYVYYYRGQSDERKLVSSVNRLTRRSIEPGWTPLKSATVTARTDDRDISWERVELLMPALRSATDRESLTVWQIYWSGDHLTTNGKEAALRSALQRLIGKGDDAAAIFLYSQGSPEQGADARIAGFAGANSAAIVDALRAARRKGRS